jgi:hypothetical protein
VNLIKYNSNICVVTYVFKNINTKIFLEISDWFSSEHVSSSSSPPPPPPPQPPS